MVVIAETEEDLIKRLNEWKNNVENRGVRVNMNKTNVMISGERQKSVQVIQVWILQPADTNLEVVDKFCYRVPSKKLTERLGIDDIILILHQNGLRWYGHVLRKEYTDWLKKCVEYEVEGSR